jgi:prephenate dehydrogenase
VLEEVSKYVSPDQLVGDISSVKAPVASALQGLPCEKVSLHPLFGPRALTLSGRSIVWSQVSLTGQRSSYLRSLLTSQGALLIDLNLDEHDQMMSVVQVTTHLHLLLFGRITADFSPSSIENTLLCATPPFTALAAFTSRMLSQDAELYADIAGTNPHTRDILVKLKDFINLLIENDTPANIKQAFLELYQPLKPFWSDSVIKAGTNKSDQIDELLRD